MSIFNSTLQLINEGQEGRIQAIPTQKPKVDQFIFGTRKATYYLYGAETGVGKTTYCRETHLHIPYEYYRLINNTDIIDVEFVDFSLEISAEVNTGMAITRRLFLDHNKVVPLDRLFRWDQSQAPLDDEIRGLINSYGDYFEDFERKVVVVDEDTTPTKLHDVLMDVAKRNGRFEREGRWIAECGSYVPFNPNKFIIVLVDTVNLSEVEPPHDTIKSSIDRISRILVWFRNKCGFTPIVIQQFNAEISAVDRNRYGIKTPLLRDFEDSKRTTKDANIIFGLYDPMRHFKTDEYEFLGYDVGRQLRSWFRSLHLLKNRNGPTNKVIPLKYDGALGLFNQLPDAIAMTPEDYLKATRH